MTVYKQKTLEKQHKKYKNKRTMNVIPLPLALK